MRLISLMLAVLTLALAGCSANDAYVKGDRDTFTAVAPEYRAYVQADPKLDSAEKQTRLDTVQSWDARIRAAEGK